MIKRLRVKFVCITMLIVTLMLCFMLGLTLNLTNKHMEEESLEMMREMTKHEKPEEEKEKKSEKPATEKEEKPVEDKPQQPEKEARLPTFTLRNDAQGNLVAFGSDTYDLTDTVYLQQVLQAAMGTQATSGDLDAYALRFVCVDSPEGKSFVFTDISAEQTTMQNLVRDCLLIGVIAFLGFLGISIFLAFWAVKPVEKAWLQQKQFVGDASHELKTPLTVIMTNAELLLDASASEETHEKNAQNIVTMSKQMRSLIDELLTLARTDDAQNKLLLEKTDFSELLEDALLPFEALFYEKGLELDVQLGEHITIEADPALLRHLAEVLLDNAQKYSLPGQVQMALRKQGRHCCFTISNPAEAISEEDLQHIFERFYRIDKARTASGSYGLGLSIAEGIVKRHQGSIRAEYKDGRLCFCCTLPVTQ